MTLQVHICTPCCLEYLNGQRDFCAEGFLLQGASYNEFDLVAGASVMTCMDDDTVNERHRMLSSAASYTYCQL